LSLDMRLPLLLFAAAVSASNLARRDDNLAANCVECPDVTPPCSQCSSDNICVLVSRTCGECAKNTCKPMSALVSPQIQKPDSSGNPAASYIIVSVCGAGVAMLLATGLFVAHRRRQRARVVVNEMESTNHLQSVSSIEDPFKYAMTSPWTNDRGVSTVSSVEWDIGTREASMAFHDELMYSSSALHGVDKANSALAKFAQGPAGATPLLPEPALASDDFLSDFLKDTLDDAPLMPAASAMSSVKRISQRQSGLSHHRSMSTSGLSSFKFPAAASMKKSLPTPSLPDIPESVARRDSGQSIRSSISDASLHAVSKVSIARIEPLAARAMLVPQRAVVGNFQSMRSESNGGGTISAALGDSRDRLSAVGSGSFSRVAATIAPGGHHQSMSLGGKWNTSGGRGDAYQKLFGKSPDNLEDVLKRNKSEREKRRESMVREAMKRASVEHVKLGD